MSEGADKPIVVFKKGFVINQLRRDAPRIAESFDRLCDNDLVVMDKYASRAFMLILTGMKHAEQNSHDVRATCGQLLLNALASWLAALDLLRDGFILQPGVLLRNMIETLIAVLCIFGDAKHWAAFQADKLKPEGEVGTASKVFPAFGQLYGFLSGTFTHVRKTYANLHPIMVYESRDYPPLDANINTLRITLWLCYVVAELVYHGVSKGFYWKALGGNAFEYVVSEKGLAMQIELLGADPAELAAETPKDNA